LSTVTTFPDRFEFTSRAHPPRAGFVLTALDNDRWSLAGELDCASGPMLLLTAEATFPRPPVLYLECGEVEFIDVAGWRALRTVRTMFEPATELRVCHPSGMLRRLMSVLGHP
jgi:anti-anti-sigma regulatory factor